MKIVVQKVKKASVSVDGSVVSQIDNGVLALVGLHKDDTFERFDYFIKKIMNLRIFEDPSFAKPSLPKLRRSGVSEGKRGMQASVAQLDLSVLLISQFTLYGDCKKGNRPSFITAMPSDQAKELYQQFVTRFGELYQKDKVKDGVFGAYMQVELINDGPVTIILED